MRSYVRRDLLRNPRRTLTSLVGVALGVGLFSGVLFFVDASVAAMTQRAVAPLTLDMQRVLSSSLVRGLSLSEHIDAHGPLTAAEEVLVTLTVSNGGGQPANEVVIKDKPPSPLEYVPGTTTQNGIIIADIDGRSPLAQGKALTGLNIGRLAVGQVVIVTYLARVTTAISDVATLAVRGKISSREAVVPIAANAPEGATLGQLALAIEKISGVAAADALSFVDLPAGSLSAGGRTVPDRIRVFAFDRRYAEHYPSIRVAAGSFASAAVLLSAEASRALAAEPGATIELKLPGGAAALSLLVSGVTDLSRAKPLFSSRKSRKFEDFLYVPNAIVLTPTTFEDVIIPAFQAANAVRGSVIRSEPVREVDVLVDRSALPSDPAGALSLTRSIAASINAVAPGQDHLIDNISNTLAVAEDDAAVGKRMFVFLGLPAALLAAVIAAYAATIHADSQRREQATLRQHGAGSRVLLRALVVRAVALAGVGSLLGIALGYLSALVILGQHTLAQAPFAQLTGSVLVALGVGVLTTGLALYLPGRRALARDVVSERRESAPQRDPVWRRLRLDSVMLVTALVGQIIAQRAGAFDAPVTSVTTGGTVSLPSALLLAPVVVWFAGVIVAGRAAQAVTSRLAVPADGYGTVVRGTLVRSLRRRPRELVNGIVGVGLVIAFGTSVVLFAATYDAAKVNDARFTLGSDLRITPSPVSPEPHTAEFTAKLQVVGISEVTPVVFGLDNSVLIGQYDQDGRDLAAIEAAGFASVATLSDSFFEAHSAPRALTTLASQPNGVLVDTRTVDQLSVQPGDDVQVVLARGTDNQVTKTLRVVGVFERFPGFPQGVHLVINLAFYQQSTGLADVDFYLARASDRGSNGRLRAVQALTSGPGAHEPLSIDSTETTNDRDQSSLTALNVTGLIRLDLLYTLLMAAATVAIFVSGLTLQRRREYVILRAQGARTRELRLLILAESGLVAIGGLAAGMAVGSGMAYMFVQILRPLFILDPNLTFALGDVARLAGVSMAAALASGLIATAILRTLRPAELLREV